MEAIKSPHPIFPSNWVHLFSFQDKLLPNVWGSIFWLIVFSFFALVAGLITFALPETRGLPVPETIEDAKNLGK